MTSFSQKIINAQRGFMLESAKKWRSLTELRKNHLEKFLHLVTDILESPETIAKFKAREALREKRKPLKIDAALIASAVGVLYRRDDSSGREKVIGNALLLEHGLLLTNYHLIETDVEAEAVRVEFSIPHSSKKLLFRLEPQKFFLGDRAVDMSIIAIAENEVVKQHIGQLKPIRLINADGMYRVGDRLNLVQFAKLGPDIIQLEHALVDTKDDNSLFFSTNAQKLMPGAAIFNQNWELIAMQQCGVPLIEKGRIISDTAIQNTHLDAMSPFVRVGERGVKVAAVIRYLSSIRMMRPEKQAVLDQFLKTTVDPLTEAPANGRSDSNLDETLNGFKGKVELHFHGDVHVTMKTLEAVGAQFESTREPSAQEPPRSVVDEVPIDRDYASRKGYDTNFIRGVNIPEPVMKRDRAFEMINDEDGEESIFDYHHFSLAINKKQRIAAWGACNMDLNADRQLMKGVDELWNEPLNDPRLKEHEQLADGFANNAKIPCRHVRLFENAQIAWGRDKTDQLGGLIDGHHWTNSLFVHEATEAAMSSGIWKTLENHIMSEVNPRNARLNVFAGPIIETSDPVLSDKEDLNAPLRMWKVIVVKGEGDTVNSYGFILDLSGPMMDIGYDRMRPERYKVYQAQLTDISERTGVVFPDIVMAGDVMKTLSLGRRGRVVLEKLNDVVLRKRVRANSLSSSLIA